MIGRSAYSGRNPKVPVAAVSASPHEPFHVRPGPARLCIHANHPHPRWPAAPRVGFVQERSIAVMRVPPAIPDRSSSTKPTARLCSEDFAKSGHGRVGPPAPSSKHGPRPVILRIGARADCDCNPLSRCFVKKVVQAKVGLGPICQDPGNCNMRGAISAVKLRSVGV